MTRYVLSELLKLFLAALVAFTGAMLLVGVYMEGSRQGLPLVPMLRLTPYVLLMSFRVSVPVALLLATTSLYSRMSGSNEVLAIKALGISPMAVLAPTLVLAVLVSLVSVWLNDGAVSQGSAGIERVTVEAVEEVAYGMLRSNRSYKAGGFSINVTRVEDRRLILPTVVFEARGSIPALTVYADEAELQADHEEHVLLIFFRNVTIEEGGRSVSVPEFRHEIPLHDASRADDSSRRPSCLPMSRIEAELAKQEKAIQRRKEELAATAAGQMLSGDFEGLASPTWTRRMVELEGMQGHLCRLRAEPYRRWSGAFSCLCFVWVGASMAIWLRNRDFLQSFFICFAPILIAYYPLFMVTTNGAKNGTFPPLAVWTGNAILALWGAWALRKVLRY